MDEGKYAEALNSFKEEPRRPIHSFHRYFGKLIPGIPAFAIETFTKPGSGTSVVEARERGRIGIGVDLNPLASFVAKIKTTPLDESVLKSTLSDLVGALALSSNIEKLEEPYVVNMDHWFRGEIKAELLILRNQIRLINDEAVRNFFLGSFSAFLRGVSNADPQHVFPGYSKRMRALDEAGRIIDLEKAFIRAVKKRIQQVSLLSKDQLPVELINGDLRTAGLKPKSIDLVVTNPPYISSIRYLETMKIEMGWLDFLDSQAQYLDLDKSVIGTERFYKEDLIEIESSGFSEVDAQVDLLRKTNKKMAKTVAKYFIDMNGIFSKLGEIVKPGGHMVIKISDSKVRTEVIATHKHFIEMCEKYGFELLADIIDQFDPNSRSLLTARNTYSGIMTFDHVLIMKKNG
jgi:methylase of polypeptide subunit release factors